MSTIIQIIPTVLFENQYDIYHQEIFLMGTAIDNDNW